MEQLRPKRYGGCRSRSFLARLAMDRKALSVAAAAALVMMFAGRASAESGPLVEEISQPHPGVVAMSYLEIGRKIVLRSGERLVLAYPQRCTREIIIGGTVSVGAEGSTVAGGALHREAMECDGGKLTRPATQATASGAGAFVVRAVPRVTPPQQ
jgi:hypothetical protein